LQIDHVFNFVKGRQSPQHGPRPLSLVRSSSIVTGKLQSPRTHFGDLIQSLLVT
jgi:hypothetical protein